jgi:hypothetical protein
MPEHQVKNRSVESLYQRRVVGTPRLSKSIALFMIAAQLVDPDRVALRSCLVAACSMMTGALCHGGGSRGLVASVLNILMVRFPLSHITVLRMVL